MDSNEICYIVFKYGGYRSAVKGPSGLKYIGGSQRTLKFGRSDVNLFLLKEQTEALCPWLRGHAYDLHYHINGTSPKNYMPIISDTYVMDMLTYSSDSHRMEVVVVVKELEEDMGFTSDSKHVVAHDLSGNIMANNDVIVGGMSDGFIESPDLEENSLLVGSRFEDSFSFKQVIRSNAIIHNLDIKIKASDKSRVIATCSYHGCPWRIRASLCSDDHSFEVKKLHPTHLCPGVNRVGNKQATTRRPRGRPKKRRIKNFLETTKKSKTSQKCGHCNSWGHHRSTCKNPLNDDRDGNDHDSHMSTTSAPREKMPIRRADQYSNGADYEEGSC